MEYAKKASDIHAIHHKTTVTITNPLPHFGLLIYHIDSTREWAYHRESHIGKLNKGLDDAGKYGWQVVDMTKDWKTMYPGE